MLQYFRNNLFFSLHYFKRLEICTFLQIIIIRKFEFLTLMTLDAIDKKDFPTAIVILITKYKIYILL